MYCRCPQTRWLGDNKAPIMVLCPHLWNIDQSTVLYGTTFEDTSKDSTDRPTATQEKKLLSRTFSGPVCKQKLKMNALELFGDWKGGQQRISQWNVVTLFDCSETIQSIGFEWIANFTKLWMYALLCMKSNFWNDFFNVRLQYFPIKDDSI